MTEPNTTFFHCPKCDVHTSTPEAMHICKAVRCHACGWMWRQPFGTLTHYTSWSDDCACTDEHPCVSHSVNYEDRPERPSDEVLRARSEAGLEKDVKRWEAKKFKLEAASKRATALEQFWYASLAGDKVNVDRATGILKGLLMWNVTDSQYEFLKVRFKDPLLWLEDCERWIGHPLVGDKAHWCFDWDGLPVDETTTEFECCSCWDKENTDGRQKEDHQNEEAGKAPQEEVGGASPV